MVCDLQERKEETEGEEEKVRVCLELIECGCCDGEGWNCNCCDGDELMGCGSVTAGSFLRRRK
jgi:hypothetical protein